MRRVDIHTLIEAQIFSHFDRMNVSLFWSTRLRAVDSSAEWTRQDSIKSLSSSPHVATGVRVVAARSREVLLVGRSPMESPLSDMLQFAVVMGLTGAVSPSSRLPSVHTSSGADMAA